MIPRQLRPRLDIRTKVVTLVALSALAPTLVVGTSAYVTARRILVEKVTNLISDRTARSAADLRDWMQTHASEGDVFASSFLLVDNLERFAGASADGEEELALQAVRTIEEYLIEVQSRSPLVRELHVVACDGTEVAGTGASRVGRKVLRDHRAVTFIDGAGRSARLVVARPVGRPDEEPVGGLVAISGMAELWERLSSEIPAGGRLLVAAEDGTVHFDSSADPPDLGRDDGRTVFRRAAELGAGIARYPSRAGREMVAGHRYLPAEQLAVVLEMDQQQSFEATYRLRDFILLICLLSAAAMTALGYWLVLTLTGPIQSLIAGAQAVAEGNLELEVPVRGGGEIGYLTEVFNDMTRSLRETHAKLEELSVTDELTGLVNRRHLGELFEREIQRADRTGAPLAVLMIDLDHFKRFNDRFGHLAGDELLSRLGEFFEKQLRPTDVAARYGGEEFALLLPGAGRDEAGATAERLRAGFAELAEDVRHGVTMSIGVAILPEDGGDEEQVLAAADQALYEAKRRGRNRVVGAKTGRK